MLLLQTFGAVQSESIVHPTQVAVASWHTLVPAILQSAFDRQPHAPRSGLQRDGAGQSASVMQFTQEPAAAHLLEARVPPNPMLQSVFDTHLATQPPPGLHTCPVAVQSALLPQGEHVPSLQWGKWLGLPP